jgi:predicted RNA-binding Zn ribbon-like protein
METRWVCLEYTHTVGWAERDRSDDELTSHEALLEWAEREGLLDRAERGRLGRAAEARPSEAARLLARALDLREVIYRIFSAVGRGEAPAESDVQALNALLPEANRWRGIVRVGADYEWGWLEGPDCPLDRALWPIIYSAAQLLTWSELRRIKLCRAHDCGWLFVDSSRNRSRRWCDMSDCGNRAKARRFRARQREEG